MSANNVLIRKNGFFHEIAKNKILYIMVVPAILFFIFNSYMPMFGIYLAFTRYDFKGGIFGSPFIWFENFRYLFESGSLWTITRNTILYNIVFIFLGNALQIFAAILLAGIPGRIYKKITQSIMFLPYFVSFVILGAFVYNILNYERGLMNSVFVSLGLERFDVYNTPSFWPFAMVGFYLWKWLGYGTVIYLAAILGISDEYYEAAEIDGANMFQQVKHITLPLLKPTFITLLLLSIGSIMRGQFELFYNVVGSNGVLYQATDIIDTFVYRSITTTFDIGLGSAAGLYQSIFGFTLIMVVNTVIKRINEDYALF